MVRELARAGVRLAKTAGGSAMQPAVAGDLAGVHLPLALRPRAAAVDLAGAPLPRASRPPLRVADGLLLHRTVAGLPLPRPAAGQPFQRTVAGLPLFRRLHTVVVVVDEKVDTATAERLAKVVKEALQDPGKTGAAAAVEEESTNDTDVKVLEENFPKLSPGDQAARDAAKRKELLRKSNGQRMLKDLHSSVKRLAAGNAPPRLQLAFGQLSSIKKVVDSMKSEADEAKRKLEDEKLWIYVVWDRWLEKLPKQVRVWYQSVREIYGHGVDLYPFVVLVVLLTTYSPVLLFGMALVAHDKYVKERKEELRKLAEEYEELSLKKKEGHVSCVADKTAVSIWICLKSKFKKAPAVAASSSTPAAQAPQASKDGQVLASPLVSSPPQQGSKEVLGSLPVSTPPPPPRACEEVPPPPPQAGPEDDLKKK